MCSCVSLRTLPLLTLPLLTLPLLILPLLSLPKLLLLTPSLPSLPLQLLDQQSAAAARQRAGPLCDAQPGCPAGPGQGHPPADAVASGVQVCVEMVAVLRSGGSMDIGVGVFVRV